MRVLFALPVLLLALGCGSTAVDEAGLSIAVSLAGPSSPALEDGVRTLHTNFGYEVRIESGFLATSAVRLLPCEDQHHNHLQEFGSLLRDLVLPRAHAHHTGGSPVELGVGAVESLLASSDSRVDLGTMAPPPGHYCGLRLTVSAADANAIDLPAGGEMVGRSLLLAGTFQHEDDAEPTPFTLESALSFEVDLPFGELDLSSHGVSAASLVISKSLDQWFDDVNFEENDDDPILPVLLDNIQASLAASQR